MFEQFMSLMFLMPVAPAETWAGAAEPVNQASALHLRLEVIGRRTPDCTSHVLAVPLARGGTLRFEDRGVRYAGTMTPNGNLILRSDAARPLVLSGDRIQGGRWSLGTDGNCVGVWKPQT
jgi:hypothetical protein